MTGYPRGATRWAYQVLKAAGCDVGFCSVFTHQTTPQYAYKAIADAPHEFEVSWFAAPFLSHPAVEDINVVRLERDPMSVASSLYWMGALRSAHNTYMEDWSSAMARSAPELNEFYRGRPWQGSLYFVCEWAEKVLELSTYSDTCVKVEDGASIFLQACGVPVYSTVKGAAPCNVSGCRRQSETDDLRFPIGKRMKKLLKERGYSEVSWDASKVADRH